MIKESNHTVVLINEIKGLYRMETPEYPIEAVREAILNAVMHRDYWERGANVQIDIFDNKLTITNIGGLISPLTKEKLGKIAVRRNPLIAELFHRIHLVEKMGTGIRRIKEECKKHGNIKFSIETNGYFIVTFRLKKFVDKTVDKILSLIIENPKITQEELAEKTGLTIRGIEWNISNLKKQKLIARIGGKKGGYWEAKK